MKKYVAIAARPGHLLPWTLLRDAELAMALVYGVVPQRTHRGSGVVERGFRMGVIPNLDGANQVLVNSQGCKGLIGHAVVAI